MFDAAGLRTWLNQVFDIISGMLKKACLFQSTNLVFLYRITINFLIICILKLYIINHILFIHQLLIYCIVIIIIIIIIIIIY